MIVAVDMDGVLADLGAVWYPLLDGLTSCTVSSETVTSWSFHGLGLSQEQVLDTLHGIDLSTLPEIPGAIDAMSELQNRGHELVICTTPAFLHHHLQKEDWLHSHGLGRLPVVYTSRKDLVRYDVLIDDAPHNTHPFMPGKTICYAHAYNLGCGTVRVNSWVEILRMLP